MKVYLKAFLVTSTVSIIFLTAFWYWRQQALGTGKSQGRLSLIEQFENEGVSDFSYENLTGQRFQFSQLRNKIVIINFWASWCGPCIEEIPSMIKLVQEMKGRVHILAISGDSALDDIHVFLKSFPDINNPNITVTWDRDRSLMKMFDVMRLPESFVISPNGKLIKKIVGTIDWYTPDSIEYMQSL